VNKSFDWLPGFSVKVRLMDLCDEQGRVLGHFVPYPGGVSWAQLELDIPEEELDRRAANFRGRERADLVAEWERRK